MGTRADFYVGKGTDAEWLGSIAFDGHWGTVLDGLELTDAYPDPDSSITVEHWRKLVGDYIADRRDGTTPDLGWPWPWDTSHTTDRSYTWADGLVWCSNWGYEWVPLHAALDCDGECDDCKFDCEGEKEPFPDMSAVSKPAIGTPRDSIMVFGGPSAAMTINTEGDAVDPVGTVEAIAMLPEADTVRVARVLDGQLREESWRWQRAEAMLREGGAELAGPSAAARGYGLAVKHGGDAYFVQTQNAPAR